MRQNAERLKNKNNHEMIIFVSLFTGILTYWYNLNGDMYVSGIWTYLH